LEGDKRPNEAVSRTIQVVGQTAQDEEIMLADNKIDKDALFGILTDFEWHHKCEFIHLAVDIPPEIATRAYLRAVPARNKEFRRNADPNIKVKYGKLRIIDEVFRHLKRSGKIEIRGRGENKEIRLVRVNGETVSKQPPHTSMTLQLEMYCWSISVGACIE